MPMETSRNAFTAFKEEKPLLHSNLFKMSSFTKQTKPLLTGRSAVVKIFQMLHTLFLAHTIVIQDCGLCSDIQDLTFHGKLSEDISVIFVFFILII